MRTFYDNLRKEPPVVVGLIAVAAVAAGALFSATAGADLERVSAESSLFLLLAVCTVVFQLLAIPLPVGAASFASAPLLAAGFLFGPAAGMLLAIAASATRYVASRGLAHRAVFDGADLALAVGVGSGFYWTFADQSRLTLLAVAAVTGVTYWLVNVGLLSVAMSLSMGDTSAITLLRDRYAWLWPYMIATAWLALGAVFLHSYGTLAVIAAILPAAPLALLARAWHGRTQVEIQ